MTIRTFNSIPLLLGVLMLPLQDRAGGSTITFTIGMGFFLGADGNKAGTDTLFQLVDLGADQQFNPIVAGGWVGGDDQLVISTFSNADGWANTAAFDLADGSGNEGEFMRSFTLALDATVYTGQMIGIRWFPAIKVTDFASTTTTLGMPYGEFTRQSSPLYGGVLWVVPSAGSYVSFDPLVTSSYDSIYGLDSDANGAALHVVSVSVPDEPSTIGLLLPTLLSLLAVGAAGGERISNLKAQIFKYVATANHS